MNSKHLLSRFGESRRLLLSLIPTTAVVLAVTRSTARASVRGMSPTICLIHGSTHGPEGWRWLAESLVEKGYRVVCPRLPYTEPGTTTAECVEIVVDSFDHADEKGGIVVVGHSISGLLLPHLANHPMVSHLVYLAAAVCPVGQSFREHFESTPAIYHPGWIEDGARVSTDSEIARHYLYSDVPTPVFEEVQRSHISFRARGIWTDKRPTPQAGGARSTYIVADADRILRPEWMEHAAKTCLGVEPLHISSGHCPHLAKPMSVTRVLRRLG